MNNDLLIVRLKQDKSLCDELLLEIGIRGVHADCADVDTPAGLEKQLAGYLKEHALVMLLITDSLVELLDAADVVVPTPGSEILFLAFGLKANTKEKAQRRLQGVEISAARSVASFADQTVRAMATGPRNSRLQTTASAKDIWSTPLYIFKKKAGLKDREILVDVTWSSKPTRPEMAPALQTALRKTFDYLGKPSLKILDFGAGKLRHTAPLLTLGHHVTAVDYRDLYYRPSDQVQANLLAAQAYGKQFGQLLYPTDFVAFAGQQFELVLLINVLNIMPDPLERLFVIEHCNKKLKEKNGYLLFFCQHGDTFQIAAASDKVTDGGCTEGKGRRTFYRDYNDKDEIIRLMKVMGFQLDDSVKIDAGKNHALLFKKIGPGILLPEPIIAKTRKILERKVYLGETDSEVAIANVMDAESYVGFGAALGATLKDVGRGKADAYAFENIITVIVEYVFRNHFTSSSIRQQFEIHERHKRIDIKAEWKTNSSLKTILTDSSLKSSFVPIECKNYSTRIGNVEFAQMVDRCDQRHRHFGMILCRDLGDKKARKQIRKECNTRYNSHNYLIIVLDDSDLQQLLLYADQSSDDDIVNYLAHKITEVRDLA